MTIITKYNLNDRLYYINNNKVESSSVIGIVAAIGDKWEGESTIRTKVRNPYKSKGTYILENQYHLTEENAFSSKEDLLKSL